MARAIFCLFAFLVFVPAGSATGDPSGENGKDGADAKAAPSSQNYTFGAKFEPPEGRVIHGMGQWEEENREYMKMLGDPELFPLFKLFFFNIEPIRPWDFTVKRIRTCVEEEKRAGRVPFLSMGLQYPHKERSKVRKPKGSDYFHVDERLVLTDAYQGRIAEMAEIFKEYGEPIFLRIGPEFNGPWNDYLPYVFPKAFRKVVESFRKLGVDNVSYIWCSVTAGHDDFDVRNAQGEYKWFPGEDAVDWFGIDVFKRCDFSDAVPESSADGPTRRSKTERFLKMARKFRKPVVIAESSVIDFDIRSDRVWEEWFAPYFSFLEAHSEIKAFVYVNANWPKYRIDDPYKWDDGRIHLNQRAGRLYVKELKKDKYLHRGGSGLLNNDKTAVENKTPVESPKRKSRFIK